MADIFNSMSSFIQDNLFLLIVVFIAVFGITLIYKKWRPVPPKPDFIKIFKETNIKDEALNKPNKYEPQYLYRGDVCLGKIVTFDEQKYKADDEYIDLPDKRKMKIEGFEDNLTTVVFKPKRALWIIWHGKEILRFKTDEAEIKDNKLIFSSDMGFTAIGREYITKTAFKEGSTVIEGSWIKRLFEGNVNVMASRMSHISAETPEMAHELSLKRLEIERIRAEKERKIGSMI
jgi:hypothetical protein